MPTQRSKLGQFVDCGETRAGVRVLELTIEKKRRLSESTRPMDAMLFDEPIF